MNEARDVMQQAIATLWEAARSISTDTDTSAELGAVMEAIAQAEAQLAGLKLHLLHEARLSAADAVVAQVRHSVRTTSAQATAQIKLATRLGEQFPLIGDALQAGGISVSQAEAIVTGLKTLPTRLTRAELQQCQTTVLGYVDDLGPKELRILAARMVEVIDPDMAETDEATRLAAEDRAAHRGRFLRLVADYHGSVTIVGQLRTADAALLSAQLEALMPPRSSYRDTGELPGPDVRRADALVLLTQAAATAGELPTKGRDRPTVHITVNHDTLVSGLGRTGLFSTTELDNLSAAEARRLACDANIIPIVLGTDSKPVDVGRTHRLFPPQVMTQIIERDHACAFPDCHVGPAACEGHHITPWWAAGVSELDNGVLLCPHHHRLVEPDPVQSAESQWQVHLDEVTGLPWFTPPRHIDPVRKPRQHTRYLLHHIQLPTTAPPPDSSADSTSLTALIHAHLAQPREPAVVLATDRPAFDRTEFFSQHASPAWHPD